MQKRTVASHYLPRIYLKHFLSDDVLFMYKKGEKFFNEKTTPENRIVLVKGQTRLQNIPQESNLYLAEVPDLNPNTVEELFQEMIENDIDSIIREAELIKSDAQLPEELRKRISILMATMLVRTPNFKRELEESSTQFRKHTTSKTIEYVDRDLFRKTYEEKTGKKIDDDDLEKAIQDLRDGKYDLEWKNAYYLQFALSTVEKFAAIFFDMRMQLLIAPSSRVFVTSDNPVVYFIPPEKMQAPFYSPRNLVHPHTEVFFPLTKQLGVTLNRRFLPDAAVAANREQMEIFNFNISQNSRDYIFSPIAMNSVRRYVETYVPYPWRFSIS